MVFAVDDTIVAIATPAGRGALGVVRLSGSKAVEIGGAMTGRTQPLQPRVATFARVRGRLRGQEDEGAIDHAVVTWFPSPGSYTGEDVVEVSVHGSAVVLHALVRHAVERGARLARPGEFTLRAFLNGKQDLAQAEAVGDLIEASTPLQALQAYDQLEGTLTRRIEAIDDALLDLTAKLEASIDFPDEGYRFVTQGDVLAALSAALHAIAAVLADAGRGRLIREGATIVIVGRPNVGKSSVFNRLVGSDRAIVSATPGTTRDMVTERVDLEGVAITLVDTAGAHDAVDAVEQEGVLRARQARDVAQLLLVVVDQSEPSTPDDERVLAETADSPRIVVANKADRPRRWDVRGALPARGAVVSVSAHAASGLPELRRLLITALSGGEPLRDTASVSNLRHITLLQEAQQGLRCAAAAAAAGAPEEFLAADVMRARGALAEISGGGTNDDVLTRIFERFCIGK